MLDFEGFLHFCYWSSLCVQVTRPVHSYCKSRICL